MKTDDSDNYIHMTSAVSNISLKVMDKSMKYICLQICNTNKVFETLPECTMYSADVLQKRQTN